MELAGLDAMHAGMHKRRGASDGGSGVEPGDSRPPWS